MPRRRKAVRDDATALTPGCEVWAYLRVSSEAQKEQGLPTEGQRLAIEAHCTRGGYRLTRVYKDEAISGSTDRRDDFLAMVEDAERRHPVAIVMWNWSRFSRDRDDAPYYRGRLRRAGIELVTLADNIPANAGELRPVYEAMADIFNERYLAELSRNVRRGQHALAEMGYIPCAWHPRNQPVGYCMVKRTIQIGGKDHLVRVIELDPETVPIARRAWEMRLAGATYQQIHDALHIRSCATNLKLMFRCSLYRGVYHWGDVEIAVPAIVTEAEWGAVQLTLGGVGGAAPRRKGSRYLLSGLVHCSGCGLPLTGAQYRPDPGGRLYRYYQCRHADARRTCGQPAVDADALERTVVDHVLEQVLTEAWLEGHRDSLESQAGTEARLRSGRKATLERERVDCQGAIANLVAAIEGGANVAAVATRLRERERDLVRIERDLSMLERETETAAESARPDVVAMRERLSDALHAGQTQAARELLKALIERVVVSADGAPEVTYRGPFGIQ